MTSSNDSSRSSKKPVVRAQRRRKTASSSSGRERAEAPRREGRSQQSAGSGRTALSSSSRQQPRSSSGSLAGALLPFLIKRPLLALALLAVLFVCVVGTMLLQPDGEEDLGYVPEDQGVEQVPVVAQDTPTSKPFVAPTRVPGGAADDQTWLVMLYQDADDKVLEQDIYVDLNEAERVGSTDRVRIVAQVDRYAGAYTADGNWTSTKRFYVTQDDDLATVGSELVADLGEQNMADGDTLVDFVTWAVETFPSDKLVLILSDHGMGWPGGWSDPAPATRGDSSTPLSSALGNQLYLHELDAALQTIRERTGTDQFEMIGMDACLMGQIEVFSMLAPHARYAVASEETEPALGWAYTSFLQALTADPGMSGAELGKLIVDSYIHDDQRIVDDEARADLVGRGSLLGGLFDLALPSSEQIADQMGRDVTLSVVDLAQVPALVDKVNALCMALQDADQRPVAQARSYAQSFTNIFGQEVPPAYIDLGNWAQLLKQNNAGAAANQAADEVLAAVRAAVVAEIHGESKPGATGMAIYFPNSQLFRTPATGPASYSVIAGRFSADSLWDDYLAFHYTGRAFDATAREAVVPGADSTVSAPGLGVFQMTPIQLSGSVAAPGRPVLLSTDITAQNLGHVLFFAGYYDRESNSMYVADMDYMESADTRQVDGVHYPVWPTGEFTLEFEWEPVMYYISDGETSVAALLTPASYGATAEDAVYTVDGIYTFADGESRNARLYFRDGMLRQVFGFTGSDSAAAPREIHPRTGDQFTVMDRWLDLDAQGRVVQQAVQEGDTLTFGEQMFAWEELDAAAGDYMVGFIAEDLDGNRQQAYAQVRVQ